jgi:4'-phosphopantetheinyl transferase
MLAHLVHGSAQQIAFCSGPGGKPELAAIDGASSPQSPRFNVTHSDELALVALNLTLEVGIDLERRRRISQADRIVETYFTEAERVHFASLAEPARDEAFIRGWTRKEAILKAQGVGLAGLATGYETMFGSGELSQHFTPAFPLPSVGGWTLWEAVPGEGYVAALAQARSSRPLDGRLAE